jgi:hypothetical protein
MSAQIIAPPLPRGRGWDFATHKRYGYVGGDDYEVPTGTSITSIADGTAAASGTTVTVYRPDGTSVLLRHVYPTFNGTISVGIGSPLARSGADGGKWPHWEGHLVNGVRVPVGDLVAAYTAATSAAGGVAYVKRIAAYLNSRKLGYKTAASGNGIRGPIYWRLIQLAGKRDGLYGKGYLVNGIPGARSRELEKYYATLAK